MKKLFTPIIGLAAAMTALVSTACAAQPNLAPNPAEFAEDANMNAYILLDRTGSMSSIWEEALNSVNVYAASLGTKEENEIGDVDANVTLAVFDAQDGLQYDLLRTQSSAKDWNPVTNDEANPRGMTPLFDAIGRIVATAEADGPDKAVIVVMTDGAENSSRELTKDGARAALDRARNRGWEVVFLGAEFANFDDAEGVGNAGDKNMAVSADSLGVTMDRLAKQSRGYAKGEQEEIIFDEEDRAAAKEGEVQQRKGQ